MAVGCCRCSGICGLAGDLNVDCCQSSVGSGLVADGNMDCSQVFVGVVDSVFCLSCSDLNRPQIFSVFGLLKNCKISESDISLKSMTIFSQELQNLPCVSGVIRFQSSWQGFSIEIRFFFMDVRFFGNVIRYRRKR